MKPRLKDYAQYFKMSWQLGICSHSEIIAWVDRLIEKSEHLEDWMIDLSTSVGKKEQNTIYLLDSLQGTVNFEIVFRLLIAKLGLVKPVLLPENNRFVKPEDSRLLSNLYVLVQKYDDLPEEIRSNIFQVYCTMDYVDEGYMEWSIIQQNYEQLLSAGNQYKALLNNP